MRLAPGNKVGPYEVLALLGAGGMAEVYRARDTRLGRDVALKVVSEALGTDPSLVERFERESKLAGALNHPNVLALYDVGFHEGKPYFVTELLEGESLRERLAKGALPHGTALEWAAHMAQGLAAAHARGIAHRDLKPENVFLTRDGQVKLIDFGIAKLVESAREAAPHGLMDKTASPSGSDTGTGMVLGTPGYMSPEQVRGDAVDARTDLFSFGAVLYEMLAGHRAFASGSVVETGYAVLHGEPEPLPSTVPPAAEQLVRRCLEKEPGRRFQSARDLAFYLDVLRAPSSGSGSLTPVASLTPQRRSRSRWARPALGLLVAALLCAIAGAFVLGRSSRPPMPTEEQVTFRRGRISGARFNPEGRIVFSAAWEGLPLEVFSRASGSVDAQPLGVHDAALLAVSPTGELAVLLRPQWLYQELRGTLARVPGDGGAPRALAENVLFADWSPSGELAVVRDVGGRSQLEYPLGTKLSETGRLFVYPRVSPDGTEVAVIRTGSGNNDELLVINRQGETRVLAAMEYGTGVAWAPNCETVWFSSRDNAIRSVSRRGGKDRLVYQSLSWIRLLDISRDGRVLVSAEDVRVEVTFVPGAGQREQRLAVTNSTLIALSADGRRVLLTDFGQTEEGIYLRPLNGSSPLRLGTGTGLAISPDGETVLAQSESSKQLSLLPVGPGSATSLEIPNLFLSTALWLHDGKRLAAIARPEGETVAYVYLLSLSGAEATRLSKAPVGRMALAVSPDDRFVAAQDANEVLTLYPVDGATPIALPELGKGTLPTGWAKEGELWVRPNGFREIPARLLRYDVVKRRVLEERTVTVADTTGIVAFYRVLLTPDGRGAVFGYEASLGTLYTLSGLAGTKD